MKCSITILFLLLSISLYSQEKKYVVMFYNVENLFDIYDDPNVADEEFTPNGAKKWTRKKYDKKVSNIAKVIYSISEANKDYPAIIGFSEIENRSVVDAVISDDKLEKANYQIVHYDSPERRGVDVALVYRPDIFKLEWSDVFQPVIPEKPDFKTRDILAVCGTIEGERFCFFVNHWSSRWGGMKASEFLRLGDAHTLKRYADSLQNAIPGIKIVIMGDMNDDPDNKSLAEVIGGKEKISEVEPGGYFNPFLSMFKAGYGSLGYHDGWNLFDNMIVSSTLIDGKTGQLQLIKPSKSKFYGTVFKRPFMLTPKGKYKNYPLRTFSGNKFLGGFSDHLPVFILIGK